MQRFRHRRRIFSALLALGLAVPSAAPAQEAYLPRLSDTEAAQFPAIGRLGEAGFRTRQGCTATLIAPDLIVTAAHCVTDGSPPESVFVAGWSRGDYIAARKTVRALRHPAYALDGTHRPRNDVALLVLEDAIPDVAPIPLGTLTPGTSEETEVALVGYHRRTPHLLSGDFACPVRRLGVGVLHVGCPVINGNSGGPVLSRDADGAWQIVGIVSSQLADGAAVAELPDWLRREVAAHQSATAPADGPDDGAAVGPETPPAGR